ncbi:DNA-processing protein DprA [Tuwongella immobilis]|uniref:Helix-hairpin-helix DNA-binding motif class 1 domain-containing protein n=1 Tax=Tuwongella immobilis TaxID=692036 RepID=A0A6C2YNH0_9BACT|nr:DNA-processing protein DprA [Tuwongella immobilis]VIP02934.1 dna protecting protein : DNA protecting protein DprA OS=Planctomyces brasiliensis (strain ATCC 49424 / DSM 5305 / JCM 21570 / NBRC 103401 / IFAM 1448) GN=Plabr_3430 PE=4 SV=1: HHH_5: DNA_processg_A [Tuwongella immobilis]VTS02890.1 dna protecting protein : DNA protecting protein DprA OS=Planctomyces brasiliensis (strain ATCC 49424 / DSM 5305 / JCM 21570 / NBRC 103401 / IFAM 1448) GN=Plabr_3430 PE=4 SV=1: HHH_5: DNA_processg_A [Tuwonge
MSSIPDPDDPLADWIALSLIPGLGPILTRNLVNHFGSPGAVRRATESELLQVDGIGEKTAALFVRALQIVDPATEMQLMQQHGVRVIVYGSPEYPQRLTQIANPPMLLYVRGTILPEDSQSVAVIGSRQCTAYGRKVAERLSYDLGQAGYTVISGLARGIDACAHRGALSAKGRTLAVLAGGLAKIYPPEHRDLADEVAASGALITESPMRMQPEAGLFPSRNRLISGLVRGVVVVEANERSGTMTTVSHAAEQGREVFAIPGEVTRVESSGCHLLIRKGVRLIRGIDDLLEDLQGVDPPPPVTPPALDATRPRGKRSAPVKSPANPSSPTPTPPLGPPPVAAPMLPSGPPLDPELQAIVDLLGQPQSVDDLVRQLKRSVSELARQLMQLEMKKRVRRLPGNLYERR